MVGARYSNSMIWLVRDTYPCTAIWLVRDTFPDAAIWLARDVNPNAVIWLVWANFFRKKNRKGRGLFHLGHYRWTQNTNLIVIVALAVKLQGPLLQVYKRVCMKILPLKDREITGLKFCWDFFLSCKFFYSKFLSSLPSCHRVKCDSL